jgi:hypothetical protein
MINVFLFLENKINRQNQEDKACQMVESEVFVLKSITEIL